MPPTAYEMKVEPILQEVGGGFAATGLDLPRLPRNLVNLPYDRYRHIRRLRAGMTGKKSR